VRVEVDSVVSLVPGVTLDDDTATLGPHTEEPDTVGKPLTRVTQTLQCTNAAVVYLKATASDGTLNSAEMSYAVQFGGQLPTATDNLSSPDPSDRTGPRVIFSWPPRDGQIAVRESILLRFDEPISRTVLNDQQAMQIASADGTTSSDVGAPALRLSDSQRE